MYQKKFEHPLTIPDYEEGVELAVADFCATNWIPHVLHHIEKEIYQEAADDMDLRGRNMLSGKLRNCGDILAEFNKSGIAYSVRDAHDMLNSKPFSCAKTKLLAFHIVNMRYDKVGEFFGCLEQVCDGLLEMEIGDCDDLEIAKKFFCKIKEKFLEIYN